MKVYPLVLGSVQTNCYIISNQNKVIIIDPAENPEKVIHYLNEKKLEVEGIFITHGHFDHIGAVNELATIFNVPVYAHKKEKEYFEKPEINLSTMIYKNLVLRAELNFHFLEDGEIFECLGTKVKALHVPGHTLGSLCYSFESEKIIFTGDTLFAHSIGRTDFIYGDQTQLVTAIKKNILTLPEDTLVYPGHGECTTVKDEAEQNPFLK